MFCAPCLQFDGDNMAALNYGGHLGRHLKFQSYSSMLERLSTQKL